MTFATNGLTSPRDEASYTNIPAYSSVRPIGSSLSSRPNATSAERASLQRRFTTNAVPTVPTLSSLSPLSPIGQQRRQAAEQSAVTSYDSMQQKKRNDDLEAIRQRQRALQSEMALLNLQEDHIQHNIETDLNRLSLAGNQSEPTTPPEYANVAGFPTSLSRPNRLSLASLSSLSNTHTTSTLSGSRASRSGSTVGLNHQNYVNAAGYPAQSVPVSRRGSDEEEDDTYDVDVPTVPRRKNVFNRLSMPITNHDMRNIGEIPDVAAVLGTGLNAILNDDEDNKPMLGHAHSKSMIDSKNLLRMGTTHDNFPVLVRDTAQKRRSMLASTGYDLTEPLEEHNGWGQSNRHRAGQQSLPMNTLRNSVNLEDYNHDAYDQMPTKTSALNRRSLNQTILETPNKRLSLHAATPGSGMPKLQASYSTNDIPTLKNLSNITTSGVAAPSLTHAQQHLQNHNASLGRVPASVTNRLSRDLAALNDEKVRAAFTSALQPGAVPFAVSMGSAASASALNGANPISPSQASGAQGINGYNYGVNMMNAGASPQHFGQLPNGYNAYTPGYGQQTQQAFTSPQARAPDSQARVMAQRRQQNTEENARATNLKIEDIHGRVVELSKDQHGCRFLQRKIEDRDPEAFAIIFDEAKLAIVDLMTDPFGNYLCQKLLEFSDNERRTVLINNAAPFMVKVALNQHGTRALQKMIEFIDSEKQIECIIRALDGNVVTLIQDLNGNHVIQKCLNHLQPGDAQFIFDAVGKDCLLVGTHRHGCCVLQRCIDHAAGDQKAELIRHITRNAYKLVQDPFGNYVVQYILDLNNPAFTQPLCMSFTTRIAELSRQKFSSNVIEKCIRVSDAPTRRILVEELMLDPAHMERLLRDNFANYVVQTALDHSDKDQQDRLWDIVVPLLTVLRGTPCGRRLLGKFQAREKGNGGGLTTPARGGVNGHGEASGPYSTGHSAGYRPNGSMSAPNMSHQQQTPMYVTPGNAFSGYTSPLQQYGSNSNGVPITPTPHRNGMTQQAMNSHLMNNGTHMPGMPMNGMPQAFQQMNMNNPPFMNGGPPQQFANRGEHPGVNGAQQHPYMQGGAQQPAMGMNWF